MGDDGDGEDEERQYDTSLSIPQHVRFLVPVWPSRDPFY